MNDIPSSVEVGDAKRTDKIRILLIPSDPYG